MKKPSNCRDSGKGATFALDLYLSNAIDTVVQNLIGFDQNCKRVIEGKTRVSSNLRFARIKFESNEREAKNSCSAYSESEAIELGPQFSEQKKQPSVQEFFHYAQTEGKQFFEDGKINLEELEVAMSKARLPKRYARELWRYTRGNFLSETIGWKQFLKLMEKKETAILQAYTTLCLSKSGTFQQNQVTGSLVNEDNAAASARFRNFMLLLPSEYLEGSWWYV